MTSLSAPQKLLYQILRRESITGMFFSKGVSRKCKSIFPAPSKSPLKCSGPTAKQILNPTVLHKEKRPPTQSFIGKVFSGAIPKAAVFSVLVETATKCLLTAVSGAFFKNQARILWALLRVSWVVKVLDTITKRVVSGFNPFKTSSWWSPSTLETKRTSK